MSAEQVKDIIGKAVVEADYRKLLFSQPEKALEGYDLTEEERASLLALEEDAFDAFASELEERVSKGFDPTPFVPGAEFFIGRLVVRM